jgi:hypothetical protein
LRRTDDPVDVNLHRQKALDVDLLMPVEPAVDEQLVIEEMLCVRR